MKVEGARIWSACRGYPKSGDPQEGRGLAESSHNPDELLRHGISTAQRQRDQEPARPSSGTCRRVRRLRFIRARRRRPRHRAARGPDPGQRPPSLRRAVSVRLVSPAARQARSRGGRAPPPRTVGRPCHVRSSRAVRRGGRSRAAAPEPRVHLCGTARARRPTGMLGTVPRGVPGGRSGSLRAPGRQRRQRVCALGVRAVAGPRSPDRSCAGQGQPQAMLGRAQRRAGRRGRSDGDRPSAAGRPAAPAPFPLRRRRWRAPADLRRSLQPRALRFCRRLLSAGDRGDP